jgi:hypothetical protein
MMGIYLTHEAKKLQVVLVMKLSLKKVRLIRVARCAQRHQKNENGAFQLEVGFLVLRSLLWRIGIRTIVWFCSDDKQ